MISFLAFIVRGHIFAFMGQRTGYHPYRRSKNTALTFGYIVDSIRPLVGANDNE